MESILEARAILGTISGSDSSQGKSAEHHRKSALKRLQEAGYLAVTGQTVRLGPVVATWSEGQVNVLRTVYDQLPVAPDSYAATAPVGERPEQAAETDEADEAGRLDEDPALDLDGQEEAW